MYVFMFYKAHVGSYHSSFCRENEAKKKDGSAGILSWL